MLFRVDSSESQLNSYIKSKNNNKNNNNLHGNYLITHIEIDLINNDERKQNNVVLNMKPDNTVDTIEGSNIRFVDQNDFEIRNIDDKEENECQDGENTKKHSDDTLTDKTIDCQFKERTDSIDTTRASNFFSIFFNFM